MWHRFLAVLLMSSLVQSQTAQTAGSSQSETQNRRECHSVTQESSAARSILVVSSHTRYNQLRQGHDEEIVVVLCHPVYNAVGCPLSTLSNQAELIPLALELKPLEGFTVRYRQGQEFRDQQQGFAVQSWNGLKVFRLKVRARDKAALGTYVLQGKLTFRRGHAGQLGDIQQMDVAIPLTIVEHKAQVVEAKWTVDKPRRHGIKNKILVALTAPIWFPAVLGLYAIYEISGGD